MTRPNIRRDGHAGAGAIARAARNPALPGAATRHANATTGKGTRARQVSARGNACCPGRHGLHRIPPDTNPVMRGIITHKLLEAA
jgi:hypothetical protein